MSKYKTYVEQSGVVTPSHFVVWTTDGVIQDGGPGSVSGGPFLPLSGGTVTGPTLYQDTVTSATAPPILSSNWTVSNTDTSAAVQAQTHNFTNITTSGGQPVWANRDELYYTSPTPSATGASYIARTIHTVAQTDRGTSVGSPQMWGVIVDAVDTTGHVSSVAGNLLALEVDVEAGLADDANQRQAIVINVMNRNYPTTATCEIATGLGVFADAHTTMKSPLRVSVPYSEAGLNLSGGTSLSGAPAIWLADNTRIAFDTSQHTGLIWNTFDVSLEFQWLGSAVFKVTNTGNITTGGVNFGSVLAGSLTDLSHHIALYGTGYGLSVTPGAINMVVNNAVAAAFTTTGFAVGVGAATINSGTGAATGTQPSGSLWLRTDGTTGARLYVSAGGGTWAAVAGV